MDIPKDIQQTLAIPDWDVPMDLDAYISRLPPPPSAAQLQRVVDAIKEVRRGVLTVLGPPFLSFLLLFLFCLENACSRWCSGATITEKCGAVCVEGAGLRSWRGWRKGVSPFCAPQCSVPRTAVTTAPPLP